MWLRLIVACMCLVISMPSFALGTDQHVLGTITAIDATHVEIKTAMGQLVTVQVNKKTRYMDESKPKKATMPEIGNRVVIKAEKIEKKGENLLLAIDIHFSSAKRAPAATQPAPIQ
jgi:phage baseplate assembly protein gpV